MDISKEDLWVLVKSFFEHEGLVRQHLDSYNEFIENGLQQIVDEDTMVDEKVPEVVFIAYSLPMLPFILAGYLISLTIVDLIFHFLALLI